MRYVLSVLLISSIFVGCGYKADPIYVDNIKQENKKQ